MSANKARSRLGFLPAAAVLLLIFGLVGAMAIEPTRRLLEQRDRINRISKNISKLERSNTHLEERIRRLKDPDYIEQRAHELRGLVKPGQIPYVIVPPTKSEDARGGKAEPEAEVEPEDPGVVEGFLEFVGL